MKRPSQFLLLALFPLAVSAADPAAKTPGTLIDFRIDVQKSVPNDLGRTSVYTEVTGTDPAEVARKVKAAITDGLSIAKAQPGVMVKSGGTYTFPVYGKTNRTIESWRMRSEIIIESRDAAALSSATGKMQGGGLAVGSIVFSPAPDTRRKAENESTLEAIDAFRAQAEQIAGALKKPYRIRQMSVNASGRFPQPLLRGAAMMAAEAAPMPVEAGESNVTVNVSGQIELSE